MGKFYFITGSDDFAVKDKAEKLIVSLCGEKPEDNPELEILRGDREDMKPYLILDELLFSLRTPPFLTEKKTIWLKHFPEIDSISDPASGSKNRKTPKGRLESLTDMLKEGLPDYICLVIDSPGSPDKRKSFFKTCQAAGEVFEFSRMDVSDKNFSKNVSAIISEHVAASGRTIDHDALAFLVEAGTSDRGRMVNELDKIMCYAGSRKNITLEDCRQLCSLTPETLAWSFADSLVRRNVSSALSVIDIIMDQAKEGGGENNELTLLGMASRRLTDIVKAKAAAEELKIPSRADANYFYGAAKLKDQYPDNPLLAMHPYRAYMTYSDAARFTAQELVLVMEKLLETRRALVTGSGDPRIVLEQFVITVASGPA